MLTEQALVLGAAHRLRTCVHLQFAVNVFNVRGHGLAADIDFQSDG